jgi:tetratricopeptide (TPR) repeat protein
LFEGRSPSPFTAPSSPASTLKEIATAPSNLLRSSQISLAGKSLAAGDDVAQAMFQLPQCFRRKRYKQTEELELTQRLDDFQSRYGISHPATIDTARRLGGLLSLQGRYRAAGLLFKQCANCLLTRFGENDPRTVNAFRELASCFLQQGQLSKAEKLFDMVYLRASQIFSSSDRKFLEIKKGFGYCKLNLGDYAVAEQAFREVLAIGSQFLPAQDHLIRDCMRMLATTLMCSSQLSEAEKLLSDVMEICALCENVPVPELLLDRATFAEICRLQGKHHLAEQILREVRETHILTCGREHDHNLATTKALARTLIDLGRFIEGEELLRDATKISTKVLGEKHWMVSEPVEEVSLHSCILAIHPEKKLCRIPL